jgi:hypothetical protein
MQLQALSATCYQQPAHTAPQSTHQPGCSSHHQHCEANAEFATLKEHLADVVDEVVSVNNRQKVNKVIKKFDNEALRAQRMMTQAQQVLLTAHRKCIFAICAALTANDIAHGVDNSVNMLPHPAETLVVDVNAADAQDESLVAHATMNNIEGQDEEMIDHRNAQQVHAASENNDIEPNINIAHGYGEPHDAHEPPLHPQCNRHLFNIIIMMVLLIHETTY